ncbi:hypothetical protein LIG30_4975, partial [Burkholderia sp. lig30]
MLGVLPRIGERERRAPRTADDAPSFDAERAADRFEIVDQPVGAIAAHAAAR